MLEQHPVAELQVFAVWEPILPTDWSGPASSVLSRISDRRASQFWDKEHVLATLLKAHAREPQPKPNCCDADGILWDLAVVYPAGALWDEQLPVAVVFDGVVVNVMDQIVKAFSAR
jgi:hypothetical protein